MTCNFALLPTAIALALTASSTWARPAPDAAELDQVVVVGSAAQAAAQPGSAQVLQAEDLEQARVLTVNEALRKVPGVSVRDEEGFGLRPNIGVRGLNPTRSTKVLLLEDGLPFTYAPYGDNASYFHAPIERYERIEVLKGSGMLRFGPQTLGGVINYITPEPPQDFGGRADLALGSLGYRRAHVQLGGRGHLLDLMHKQGDGARDHQSLKQGDLNYKWNVAIGERHELTVRASVLGEDSDVTYSGLTDAEYRNLGPRYNPFANDHFDIERFGTSASWSLALGDRATLVTNAYYYEFHRDWGRQSSTTTDAQCGSAFTNARLAGERVDVEACNSRQNRNRDFATRGIEPRLLADWSAGALQGTLEAGLRLHRESQDRLQFNGNTPRATTGTLVEHNEREVDAWSGFVQNRFALGRLALIPALRYEHVEMERVNRLGSGSRGRADVAEWIPGLGLTFDFGPDTTLFAGAHEGFAPPRVEDLIGASGGSVDLEPESSRNLELGLRGRLAPRLSYELALFDNDFDNQIAVGSIAGGSTPLAQGEARYRGAELALRADFAPAGSLGIAPFLELALTTLPTAEQRSALRRVDNGQPVPGSAAGRRMPYAPRNSATLRTGVEHARWNASIEGVFVDAQYADFANTGLAPANGNGQIGRIGGHTLVNLAWNHELSGSGWTLYATVKNALDRRYVADRTRGILPGIERHFVMGATFRF
jgi:Fe(3+) dicitrate transport protein